MISAEQKRARIGFKNFNNGRRVLSSYISNSDMDQFSKFTGGLDKSYKINFIFIQSQLAAQKLARNRNIYFSEPFVAANGTTLGMQTLWRQYINANKIFTKDGKLNPARQSWSKYFASRPRKSLKEENPDMPNIRTSETGDLKIILRVKK